MKHFGVIGHPIAHSLSPLLHNTAFALLSLDCRYEAFDVEPAMLRDAIGDFKARGFSGLNVTLPHKEAVASLVDVRSMDAEAVGAVNTVIFHGDRISGDNTDVYGVVASLGEFKNELRGARGVVLGAGGSARAAVYALVSRLGLEEISVINRSPERAAELTDNLKLSAVHATLRPMALSSSEAATAIRDAALVINTTSVGMSPAVDDSPVPDAGLFHPGQIVMDLIYTPRETRLLLDAARRGARTISGLEMFLHQGARSFELWLGCQMPLGELRPVIAQELQTRATSSLKRHD
ncbi:MAG TPA: shikimate dehydrogenase [Bacteroidota bacterium]|nr:shikimate dehydrogenase [Bacteroidota bacterium]